MKRIIFLLSSLSMILMIGGANLKLR